MRIFGVLALVAVVCCAIPSRTTQQDAASSAAPAPSPVVSAPPTVRVEHPIVRLIAKLKANPNAIKPSKVEEWKGDDKMKRPPRRHFSYNHPRVDGCEKFSIDLQFLKTPTGIDPNVWDVSIDGEIDPFTLGTRVSVVWRDE